MKRFLVTTFLLACCFFSSKIFVESRIGQGMAAIHTEESSAEKPRERKWADLAASETDIQLLHAPPALTFPKPSLENCCPCPSEPAPTLAAAMHQFEHERDSGCTQCGQLTIFSGEEVATKGQDGGIRDNHVELVQEEEPHHRNLGFFDCPVLPTASVFIPKGLPGATPGHIRFLNCDTNNVLLIPEKNKSKWEHFNHPNTDGKWEGTGGFCMAGETSKFFKIPSHCSVSVDCASTGGAFNTKTPFESCCKACAMDGTAPTQNPGWFPLYSNWPECDKAEYPNAWALSAGNRDR